MTYQPSVVDMQHLRAASTELMYRAGNGRILIQSGVDPRVKIHSGTRNAKQDVAERLIAAELLREDPDRIRITDAGIAHITKPSTTTAPVTVRMIGEKREA